MKSVVLGTRGKINLRRKRGEIHIAGGMMWA